MIVYRTTFRVKAPHMQQAIEAAKSVRGGLPDPSTMRIYEGYPAGAPSYTLVVDMEFESLAALEQWLGQWFSKPDTAEFLEKLAAFQEPGGDSTIWHLVE